MLSILFALAWAGAQPACLFGEPDAESTATASEEPAAVLKAGRGLFGKKQYRQARAMLEPLTGSEDPAVRWPATFWLARCHHQERNVCAASPLLLEVARSYEPLKAQAHYWLGQGWTRKRRYKTARGCFRNAFAKASEEFKDDCLYQIAYTHYAERHNQQAAGLFGRLLEEYPKSGQAKSAGRLLARSLTRLRADRKVDVDWIANVGMSSTSQALRGEATEFGVGANARLGAQARWTPRDAMRISAGAYVTRTSYLTGELDDREGFVGSLSISQDLGNSHGVSYGLRYTENQRVDIVASDSTTWGPWVSYRMPVLDDGRLGFRYALSHLQYHSEMSSGTQHSFALTYSEPLSRSMRLSTGAAFTNSNVGAGYLSYTSPSVYFSLTKRLGKRRSLRAGYAYTERSFEAPRPRQTVTRRDIQRRFYGEYTHPVTDRISISGGWQETNRTSTQANMNRSDPSWYVRVSQLVDLKF